MFHSTFKWSIFGEAYNVGTTNREVYVMDSANVNSANFKKITQKLGTGTFVSDIAVHPEDGFVAVATHGRGVFTNFIESTDEIVGIEDIKKVSIEKTSLSIYPNPASNFIRINTSQKIDKISIYDLQGRRVYQNTNSNSPNSIDISQLPNGVYSLYLQTENEPLFGKFVVSK